ncbi:MAG: alpha/beta hydrolase [Clostridia bacterium]|nr:alpha/beta hydrolase [Clostridia bacterium]
MEPIRGTFKSTDGIHESVYKIWEPEGEIRGIVQLSHGMCEHTARYDEYARHLSARGIVFAGNDHLGHGETAKDDKDLGFFGGKNGGNLLVDDVHKMTKILKEKYPDIPLVLLGHSMGSFVARLYLSEYAEELDGAIIMGTMGTKSPTTLGKILAASIRLVRGDRHRSKLLKKIVFGGYTKRFGKNAHPASWISKDTERVLKYAADPKCTFDFTAAGYFDLFDMVSCVSTPEWAARIPVDLPMLLISGAEDPVGSYGKGVGQVAGLIAGAGAKDLTVKLFPGDRHEVLNETDREDVYEYIDGWLRDHVFEREDKETDEDGSLMSENTDPADGNGI